MSRLLEIIKEIDDIEKGLSGKAEIGDTRIHGDGKRYKKVSETGQADKDWKLVTENKDKQDGSNTTPKQGGNGASKKEIKLDDKGLANIAKKTSENTLNNTIKGSSDPKVRIAAHNEIDRRLKEEKPKPEKIETEVKSKTKDENKK